MGSRDRLFSIYGEAWGGWPPAAMTLEQDREDLAHHEREIAAHESFNYALLDAAETELLGCVYIDPPRDPDVDGEAVVSWWVVDALGLTGRASTRRPRAALARRLLALRAVARRRLIRWPAPGAKGVSRVPAHARSRVERGPGRERRGGARRGGARP